MAAPEKAAAFRHQGGDAVSQQRSGDWPQAKETVSRRLRDAEHHRSSGKRIENTEIQLHASWDGDCITRERENNFWQRRKTGIALLGGSVTWCSRGGNQCDDSSKERKREYSVIQQAHVWGKQFPRELKMGS